MSPSQASSDFPRLAGAGNFDVWKTRVRAALDGKNQLGLIDKRDYDGTSDDEDRDPYADDDEEMSAASDADDEGSAPSLEERTSSMQLDDLIPQGPDDESKLEDPPVVLPFAEARAASAATKRAKSAKPPKQRARRLTPSEVRRADARVKSFLMKTLDDKHILMVKSHDKSFDIYQTICKKYEGTTASGDPYVIMAFLFNARYEEGKDLTDFLIRYERAIESLNLALGIVLGASMSSVFLYNAMPKAWENEMRIWRSTRNIIPYEELKANLEAYVTNKLAQERFALSRGTPESKSTSSEKALVAPTATPPEPIALVAEKEASCSYCKRSNHVMLECRTLVRDLQRGQVKAGTTLPTNYKLPDLSSSGASNYIRGFRQHPYGRPANSRGRGFGGRNGNHGGRGYARQPRFSNSNFGGGFHNNNFQQSGGFANGNPFQGDQRQNNYDQGRHEKAMIAITRSTSTNFGLTAAVNDDEDRTWTIDSGCTRHVTHTDVWLTDKTAYEGSITVGGKNKVPILAIGTAQLEVIASKGNPRLVTLEKVLDAPQLKFNLLSVSAAVRDGFHFTFKPSHCAVNTTQRLTIKAPIHDGSGLYQFKAKPTASNALVAVSGTTEV